jgi:hypothetical protein
VNEPESVSQQPALGFSEIVEDLHLHVMAAENHFARLGSIIVAEAVIKSHYSPLQHVPDRADDLQHLNHRDHFHKIMLEKYLRAVFALAFGDDLAPVIQRDLWRQFISTNDYVDK